MRRFYRSDAFFLLSFFAAVILIGTAVLCTPSAWRGTPGNPGRLPLIDALFTATSAVCVTGLVTVDTSTFTRFGQTVILLLIQLGGLGIFSVASLLLVFSKERLPFRRLQTIRSFSLDGVEYDPKRIVRNIVLTTAAIESLGALSLFSQFARAGVPDSGFAALFHSVSAFCNAGFSTFPDSLEGFRGKPPVLGVVSFLIVSGGIGFIVLQDLGRYIRGRRKAVSYHTRLMLLLTLGLILSGAAAFWLLEGDNAFRGMSPLDRAANALFQSVTPRTAGFNTVSQAGLRQPSKFVTLLLMFVGGAPGSIAGGIKIATAYIVLLAMLKKANERGEVNSLSRRFSPGTINEAVVYFLKAVFLLVLASCVLSLTEGSRGAGFSEIIFEAASAFGTVGLSLGLTPRLSAAGKLVIIGTMFTGRVGLLAFVHLGGSTKSCHYVFPEADILIG